MFILVTWQPVNMATWQPDNLIIKSSVLYYHDN